MVAIVELTLVWGGGRHIRWSKTLVFFNGLAVLF